MAKYELKPVYVEAVFFDPTKGSPENDGNWFEVERMLGPHCVKIEQKASDPNDKAYYVFDVMTKDWILVPAQRYVIRGDDGSVWVENKQVFEGRFQEMKIAQPWNPHPGIVTYPPFSPYGGVIRG